MVQVRKKLIELFIGNISNSILHKVLEKAIDNEEITSKYKKETDVSQKLAKQYREKINPTNTTLPEKDTARIRTKIINKIRSELLLRISKGYQNINLDLVKKLVDKALKDMGIN